jgi:hypothetical protein
LIYPALKWGWKYFWIVPSLAVLSSIYIIVIAFTKEIYATHDMKLYKSMMYHPTHARLGAWMIGTVFGYILFANKDKKIRISRSLNAVLWIVSLSVLAITTIIYQPFYVPNNNQPLIFNAMFMAFNRSAWALGICWIIFACHKLKTGKLNLKSSPKKFYVHF